MNRNAILIFVFAVFCSALPCSSATPNKAPETSSDGSFLPNALAKLAVIASSEEKRRGNKSSQEIQSSQQRLIEDVFVQTLLQRGHVVAARSDIKSVLKEQELGNSGLTENNAVAVGKLLNVPAVLIVRITEYVTETQDNPKKKRKALIARATVGARLVSVETGSIWWQGNYGLSEEVNAKIENLMVLAKVALKLAKVFPERKAAENNTDFDLKGIQKLALIMAEETRTRHGSSSRSSELDRERLVEDKLGVQLGNKGYSLVARSDLDTLMQENQFQNSGLSEENAVEFGKLLNVPVVMVVRITECNTESIRKHGAKGSVTVAIAAIGARLVSVESGEILWCRAWIQSQQVGGKTDAAQFLAEVAKKKIGDAFPDKKPKKKPTSAGSA